MLCCVIFERALDVLGVVCLGSANAYFLEDLTWCTYDIMSTVTTRLRLASRYLLTCRIVNKACGITERSHIGFNHFIQVELFTPIYPPTPLRYW